MDWIPAVTTTTLFAAALWLVRKLIITRLSRSVQHEFDQKLEIVRADLRASEEKFKAALREKEAEIAALRSGALSAIASRQAAIEKRRLEAIDQIWAAFNSLAHARGLAAQMAIIKFEEAARETERNPKARQLFEIMGSGFDPLKIDGINADKARPFISPMAWATFAAYRAIVMNSVVKWHILKGGLGKADLVDSDVVKNLVLAALPGYKDYLEKHGTDALYYSLEGLETQLLSELKTLLTISEFDKASVEQEAEILRLANELQTANEKAERAA
ncbi:hypothetical protein [Chitinibacter fontanus]|uniref:hypothetical protein n=1 Tax=Chitinibacter fontanus TaxID=1737446 RepID=UPI0018851D66|nr:hypothetical protein [Chitinibacter fontanus]